jgi:hypothetical protein
MAENRLYSTPARIGQMRGWSVKWSQLGGALTALQVVPKSQLSEFRDLLTEAHPREPLTNVAFGTWCFPKLGRRSYEARHAHAKHAIGL